jgi:formimidoylglutamate deiminase
MPSLLIPDLLWDGRAARTDHAVWVAEGRIVAVGPLDRFGTAEAGAAGVAAPVPSPRRLRGKALLAAPVNAHSHAFQRAIRGRTQTRPAADPGADFWSWRNEMYSRALGFDPDGLHEVSRACFAEMRDSGWGSVGEFHYLHRTPDGLPYDDPLVLSDAVIEAARSVGLRICLLYVAYATADVDGSPLRAEQRRFGSESVDEVLAAVSELGARWKDDDGVTVGLAPHSVRAIPRGWWRPLAEGAEALDVPLHAHVSEQVREVEACKAVHGLRPVELLAEEGVLSERFTAVHATHLTDGEIELLASAGARVCGCPSTERDLGDGILPARRLAEAEVPVCLGSDSHTLLDPWEELRLPEYHLRLVARRRIVLGEVDGDQIRWAPGALRSATQVGGDALRTMSGRLEAGAPADLVTLDLEHSAMAGIQAGNFAEMVAVAARADVVSPVEGLA